MSIQVFKHPLSAGIQGATSALQSALKTRGDREFEREQKQTELREKRNVVEEARLRQAQSGTILQSVLSQVGPNPTLPELGAAFSSYIEQGGDPDIGKQFFAQAAPFLKEQARTGGAQSFLNQILGPQSGAAPTPQAQAPFQETAEVSGPQGTVYEQTDGVPAGISTQQIDALISSPYPQLQALGKQYDARSQQARKNYVDDRNFHAKGAAKTEEKIEQLRTTLPKRERVLTLARDAIESGEIGAFSRNRIADMIGGPIGDALRTKSGAQFAVAAKENLVTNLSEISARGVNMFMEKRLLDAFSKVGQTQEANLAIQDFFEAENDIEKAYLKEYDRLAAEDVRIFGYKRNDLAKRARKAARPAEQKIFNRSSLRQRELQEREKGVPWMYKQTTKKVDKGTPLTPQMYRIFIEKVGDPAKALVRAKQLGYSVYAPSQLPGGKA